MLDCLELLDEITEIYPIPVGVVSFPVPFQVRQTTAAPTYPADGIQNPVSVAWLRTQRGMVIEAVANDNTHARSLLVEDYPSAKGSSKTSAAGRYFQMSVSAKSHQDVDQVQDLVNYVNSYEAFDTFIVDASQNIYVIRGVYPATSIEVTTNLPLAREHEITLSVECVNGLQTL